MRPASSSPGILALAGPTVGVLLFACGGADPERAPSALVAPHLTTPPSTAGAELCTDCHETIVDSWSRTGMARSLGPVVPGELGGTGAVVDEPSGYRYEYTELADSGIQALVETHSDAPRHQLAAEVSFAIGSGERDRSFAVRLGNASWFSPLEVLTTAEGRRAILAPAHMMDSGVRFSMPITSECLGCHTDALPPSGFPLNRVHDPSTWKPRGISCAACHGDVQGHVAHQEAELVGESVAGEDPILSHGELSRVQRLSVCAACHLQGDARIILASDEHGPPAPGGDVLDVRALFVAREPTNEVGFVSQVERLALSACFLESEMTCETCHDPHRTLHEEPERRRVRAACTSCHAGAMGEPGRASACSRSDASAGDANEPDCVTCHMPKTGTFDVAHVVIHDHFVRVDTSDALPANEGTALRFDESPDADWRRFTWPGESKPAHVDDPGLLMMALSSRGHGRRALALVDETVGPVLARLPMYHHMRGVLLEHAERTDGAIQAYRTALALDPGLASSAVNLGLLLGRVGRPEEGLELLNETLALYPQFDSALRNRAALRLRLGDEDGFAADLEAAFRESPRAELARALAAYWTRREDEAKAARWRGLATMLDPLTAGG